jgi:hypothetical protein
MVVAAAEEEEKKSCDQQCPGCVVLCLAEEECSSESESNEASKAIARGVVYK